MTPERAAEIAAEQCVRRDAAGPLLAAASSPETGGASERARRGLSPEEDFPLTDLGNVDRFFARHGRVLRYCSAMGSWFFWTGTHWRGDSQDVVWVRAAETIRHMYAIAAKTTAPEERARLVDFARKCESRRALEALVSLSANLAMHGGISVAPDEFDSNPWILNTPSGVVDLRTGSLRPHDRRLLCTRITAAKFVPDAQSDAWDRFLDRVLPDPVLRAFVQRATGSALVGLQRDERLFFVHGPAGTGKSTFMRAIQTAIGTYGTSADFETFLERRPQAGGAREDLAALAGRRLVVSLEVDEGGKLAVSVVKALTGGDTIATRHLYGRVFTFIPQMTLFLVANVRPRVPAEDEGMWRRVLEVPFLSAIPESERDASVKETLCDASRSGAAILRWLVDGCLAQQRDGLGIPDSVRSATADYRAEVDSIGRFLDETTVRQPGIRAMAGELYGRYRTWTESQGEKPLSAPRFKARMEARGFKSRATNKGHVWDGIGLVATGDETE